MNRRILIALLAVGSFICPAVAQKVALKTNLLYDATSTMNLGFEFGLSPKWTLDVYNPQNEMLPFHKTKCSETQNEMSSL